MTTRLAELSTALSRRLRRHGTMLSFAGANLLLQAAALVSQFWVLRFIPPEQMGIWAFASLLEGYLLVTQLGVINAMNREYPFSMGRGHTDAAFGAVRTAQAYTLCNAALLALTFVVLAVAYGARGIEWRVVMLTSAVTLPLAQYLSYLEGTYRAGHEFRQLSLIRVAQAGAMIATVALPWRYGFEGYCGRVVLLALLPAALGHLWRPLRLRPGFDRASLKLLLATGWRLHLWSYLYRAAQSFPRLALATLGGTVYLGLFVPVNVAYQGVSSVAGSFNAYLYPTLTRRYAQSAIPVGRVALKAAAVVMTALAPGVALGIVLLPLVVRKLLPEYTAAVQAAQVTLVAGLLETMSIATLAFAAAKAWRLMFVYLAAVLILRAAGALGGYLLLEDRLLGVAWGMLAASALAAAVTWATVWPIGSAAGAEGTTDVAGEPLATQE